MYLIYIISDKAKDESIRSELNVASSYTTYACGVAMG